MYKDDCVFMDSWLQMEGTFHCCKNKKRIKEMLWDKTDDSVLRLGKLFPNCDLCDHYTDTTTAREMLEEGI